MKKDPYQIIKRPLITEKGMSGVNDRNQYPFEVALDATKADVKMAVEAVFTVHVKKVCTMMRAGKPRRYRYWRGTMSSWKRAVVTLAPGETIEFI